MDYSVVTVVNDKGENCKIAFIIANINNATCGISLNVATNPNYSDLVQANKDIIKTKVLEFIEDFKIKINETLI